MTLADIQNKIYFLTKTNSTSFPNATMVIEINNAIERVVSLILQSDGRWQYEDSNQTDLPIAVTSIVSGQQDYSLATSHIKILRVEVKDSNNTWHLIEPRDADDVTQEALSYRATLTGVPTTYDVLGASVFLDPTPNYSQASSLKLFFQRGPVSFTTSDLSTGTSSPGFNSLYHDLVSLWVAYNYALVNKPEIAAGFFNEIDRREKQLVTDYGHRDKDDAQILTTERVRFR